MEAPTDAQLVAAALRRDERAFVDLFRRHASRVSRALRAGFQLNAQEAEDVTQESFIRAFQNLGALQQRDRFGAWVQVIARREALAERGRSAQREQAAAELAVGAVQVEEPIREETAIAVVRALLSELQEGIDRSIVTRFYVDGDCTAQQLADELGVAKGTITSRLTRFRARIKRRLLATLAAAGAHPLEDKP